MLPAHVTRVNGNRFVLLRLLIVLATLALVAANLAIALSVEAGEVLEHVLWREGAAIEEALAALKPPPPPS